MWSTERMIKVSLLFVLDSRWTCLGNDQERMELHSTYEPPHDKTNKLTVRPAKTQNSLGIRPVWSESSLCAKWVAKDPSFLHADSEDSDPTGRMLSLRWAHMPFCWFCHEAAHIAQDIKRDRDTNHKYVKLAKSQKTALSQLMTTRLSRKRSQSRGQT